MSSTPNVSKSYVCATCGRQYQRNTHLRRHEATHTRPNRFKCPLCQKEFSRSDVCKKHCLACPLKNKEQSQDSNSGSSSGTLLTSGAASASHAGLSQHEPTATCYHGMPFLKQIFNPNTVTMQHYLNVANNDGSFNENVPDSDGTPESSPGPSQDISDVMALLPSYHTAILDDAIGSFMPGKDLDMLSISGLSPIPALTDAGYEILVAKAASLVSGLCDLHYELEASGSAVRRPHDIGEVENVFCAEKIRFFAAAFFRLTHVHFPLVHYPTFGVPETSSFLILAVTIFGASRCAPFKHTVQAQEFTALAEEYIFRELHRLNTEVPSELALEQLQTIQAAVAITNFMINHNDWSLRERGRLIRLPTLIYSVRLFKLAKRHRPLTLDWHQFIFNETAARVATLTAVVDWNQARMCYCPPNLAVAEMKCSLPCHRELWDAPNATAYIVAKETVDAARLASTTTFNKSIADFLSSLMADAWPLQGSICHLNLTLESLSAASFAITALTVSACQMLVLQGASLSIIRAITRWRELWDRITQDMDPEVLLKAGLTRHCHENCTLAQHILETWKKQPDHQYFQTIGHNSLSPIFNLLPDDPIKGE